MAGIYTVSQVNSYIGGMFREDFLLSRIRVRGEASNVKYHSSGHIYFTIKDPGGTLSAVMFSSRRRGLSFRLQDGQKIVVGGSVQVYERGGVYQLYADTIEEEGSGELYREFLRLKAELGEMGMFAPEYKQPIPKYIRTLGIVTASTGAAVRDMINVSTRRDPYIQIVLCPAIVQGDQAADSIVRGIRTLDRYGVDVIIVGRGGGSIEDLWAFNEEKVARAIFECGTPIISAVGHETDFTIADFAADLRAPTPSAAAELAVTEFDGLMRELSDREARLKGAMGLKAERLRQRLSSDTLRLKLRTPGHLLNERRTHAAALYSAMSAAMKERLSAARQRLFLDAQRLSARDPLDRLKGGYAYVTDGEGNAVKRAGELSPGQTVALRFRDGSASARILETEKNE